MTATFPKQATPHRLCPACGEFMVASRCPECAPSEPARPYSERVTQPFTGAPGAIGMAVADARRATSEWVTGPDDRDPQTRRAHPTLVRSALAEAEERARDTVARSALVTHVATTTRPRHGSTSPRLRTVTPLPPAPIEAIDAAAVASSAFTAVASEPSVRLSAALVAEFERAAPKPALQETQRVELPPYVLPRASRDRQLVATSPPDALDDLPESASDTRRVQVFWMVLIGTAALVLAIAAI